MLHESYVIGCLQTEWIEISRGRYIHQLADFFILKYLNHCSLEANLEHVCSTQHVHMMLICMRCKLFEATKVGLQMWYASIVSGICCGPHAAKF